jgi:hypothetical protein
MVVEKAAEREPAVLAVEVEEGVEQSEAVGMIWAALIHPNRHRKRLAIWSLYWRLCL